MKWIMDKWNSMNKKGKMVAVVFCLVVLWAIYNQIW